MSTTNADGRLWGVLPPEKLVLLGGLAGLRSSSPVLTPGFRRALVDGNPWRRVLAALGHAAEPDPGAVPIEEGETSLNANGNQVLMALLPLLDGAPSLTVVGSMAGGNHGLIHALERQAASFRDAPRARAALVACFGDAALTSVRPLLDALPRHAARSFDRLPLAVRRVRALRLPSCRLAAPGEEPLDLLFAALRLHPELRRELSRVRAATAAAGLPTAADAAIAIRAWLVTRLADLLGRHGFAYLPTSLEHLIVQGTDDALPRLTLRRLAAAQHALFRARAQGGPRAGPVWSGRYRLLNHYDPARLLTAGRKRAGRPARFGWTVLKASYDDGQPLGGDGLADLTVAELLARGYGLSGKLTYMAVRAVNGGAVCNLALRGLPDVFAPLADPEHPCRVLPLASCTVYGDWQLRSSPQLDLLPLADWLYRSRRPERTLARLLAAFRDRVHDPRAAESSLVLEQPGAFTLL